jgi:glutamine synthetase
VAYQAEYIWIDGGQPTPLLRSKTKILADGASIPGWGFDGSSTEQATGDRSDCLLNPVKVYPDPIRKGANVLVMCEVLLKDGKPHPTNTRSACAKIAKKYAKHDMWFGLEQEYTMMTEDGWPFGFPPGAFPKPQGPYYCGVGAGRVVGRDIVERHTQACIDAGIEISGTNAEVMPGQWEFQVGPLGPLDVSDDLYVARWLLHRIAEDYGVVISFDAKPMKGDWNGAGCHTNFSTKGMREVKGEWEKAAKALGATQKIVLSHVENYGHDIQSRLTGKHETAPWNKYTYGESDRGASVRIPMNVARDGKGYIEDRRPNANMDPYTVTRLITDTVCSVIAG